MDPTVVSQAIVMWSGRGQMAWPQPDGNRVVAAFGPERGYELVRLVEALADDFHSSDAHTTAVDLVEMGERASSEFRLRHPEISDAAVAALAWCYTFDNK